MVEKACISAEILPGIHCAFSLQMWTIHNLQIHSYPFIKSLVCLCEGQAHLEISAPSCTCHSWSLRILGTDCHTSGEESNLSIFLDPTTCAGVAIQMSISRYQLYVQRMHLRHKDDAALCQDHPNTTQSLFWSYKLYLSPSTIISNYGQHSTLYYYGLWYKISFALQYFRKYWKNTTWNGLE